MERYRDVIKVLKEHCPADLPIKVRRTRIHRNFYGDCSKFKDHYLIRICHSLNEEQAINILVHEWSHAISWHKCQDEWHSSEWGKAYSKVYRVYLQKYIEETYK